MLALHRPAMTTAEPADDGLIIGFGNMDIAKDSVVETTLHGLLDEGSGTEVHVGHPQGKHIGVVALVPLDTVGAPTGNDFVKIVSHGIGVKWFSFVL